MFGIYLFIFALLLSIAIGFVLKINAGYVALLCAFVNGLFFYGFSVKKIVAMWPVSLFLMILTVMLFYGFALANGSIEVLASNISYRTRKYPFLLPIVLWIFCTLVSASGAGSFGVFAFLSPIIMGIALKAGIPRLLAAAIIISGGSAGSLAATSVGGAVIQNYAAKVGYADTASAIVGEVFWESLLIHFILIILCYVAFRAWKLKPYEMEKPAPLNEKQKKNLVIILVVLALTLIPPFLYALMPASTVLKLLKDSVDVTVTSTIGIVLCLLFKVSTEKEALAKVPWATIMLICGIGVLIQTAVEIGIVTTLSTWIEANVSGQAGVYILILVSAVMSFFSSSLGVVVPTLSVLVPIMAEITGRSPSFLFAAIVTTAMLTGFSPFSSAGALTMSGVPSEEERNKLFKYMLAAPVVLLVYMMLVAATGIIR